MTASDICVIIQTLSTSVILPIVGVIVYKSKAKSGEPADFNQIIGDMKGSLGEVKGALQVTGDRIDSNSKKINDVALATIPTPEVK